jgi:NADH-quinone oxidoreductase subunit E
MAFELSDERKRRLEALRSRYPNPRAACLQVLHLAQEEHGQVDDEVVRFVSEALGMQVGAVEAVASFYTMYNRRPIGRYHLQICTNLSCSLMGAEHLRELLERELGVRAGQTTADGMFTWTEVECLASCGTAPVMQVNDDLHENLEPGKVKALLADLRAKAGGGAR